MDVAYGMPSMAAAKKKHSNQRDRVPGPYSSRVPTSPGEVRLPAGSRGLWLTFGSWTFHDISQKRPWRISRFSRSHSIFGDISHRIHGAGIYIYIYANMTGVY